MTDKHWKWVGVNGTNEIPEDCALNGARACFDVYCLTPAITGKLFVIDSEKELEMAIGRNWKLGALPKVNKHKQTKLNKHKHKQTKHKHKTIILEFRIYVYKCWSIVGFK